MACMSQVGDKGRLDKPAVSSLRGSFASGFTIFEVHGHGLGSPGSGKHQIVPGKRLVRPEACRSVGSTRAQLRAIA
jgi:hypothetical protein